MDIVCMMLGDTMGGGRVELIGLEGTTVTKKAKAVVEKAGYEVTVRTVPASDLVYLKAELGASRLPVVRTETKTIEGMSNIRTYFSLE